jgi:hypothetical protein
MQPVEHVIDPEELNEYFDRELPATRAAEIDAHVKTCVACQRMLADLRGVSRDLDAWTIDDVPASLRARDIADKTPLRRRRYARWVPSWATVPAIGVAAVCLLVVATLPKRAPGVAALTDTWPPPSVESRVTSTTAGKAAATPPQPPVATAPAPSATREPVRVAGRIEGGQPGAPGPLIGHAPRVMRTASLRLVAGDFENARAAVDRIAGDAGGYVGTLTVGGTRPAPRTLTAVLHVPADRTGGAVAALRALGEVVEESQASQDMSERLVDLEARLANARNTEERLRELLRTRTGRLSDVLEAEREVTRVRQEIEVLDAQRKNIETRVTYSAITLQIDEEHKSSISLGPQPLAVRLRNALVDGFRTAFEAAVTTLLLVLQLAPVVIFWLVVIGLAVRYFLRRRARASA